ncbi:MULTISPECIES: ABC transporter substrate-binding protein [Aestuariimicrobium]|uniref:ABC transporter substrate-binding protein n=1 Tax=Aestuariimicrobium TaxID=396388 RepID=UPI0003B654F8|nr:MULTISPECIES: iron-siderophore ABC transporter substrate-binding protein [Aestuariimicrobium]CAI9401568.1 Petrobactin-binding protein FpuA [Aestuariimicrobium sp. T2.26MG-19.2B]
MSLTRRALFGASAGLSATALLAACGTTEAAQPRTSASSGGSSAASSGSSSAATARAITVIDSRGRTITLAKPATRVVTLEWGPTEDVLTLGVQPVGVADVKGFGSWVSSQKLSAAPIDVGMRSEPSLESIARAEPDLILGVEGSVPDTALAQAEKIAPVVLLTGAKASDPLGQVRRNFTDTALLLGRSAEAERIWSEFETHLADSAAKLASVTSPYVFSYVNVQGSSVDVRMHSDRSVPGAVAKKLGLTNAYTEPGDEAWGIGSLDLEGLTTLDPSLTFLNWANGTTDPTKALAGNAVWKGLPFVRDGRVKAAANGIWVYGGPASLTQWVDELVTLLAA